MQREPGSRRRVLQTAREGAHRERCRKVIWHIGTDRILGVGDEDEIIPDGLSKALSKPGDVYGRDVFGDFEVCPLTKSKAGEMQVVCVASASHLVVRENTH